MSSKLDELVNSAESVPIETVHADLRLPEEVESLTNIVREKYTTPTHILHLAAGKFQHMRLRQFDGIVTREEMETQVFSLAEVLKAFLPNMAKNHYGKVVAMLTAYTFGIPPKFVTSYIMCKYALLGLVKAVAAEYCDKGDLYKQPFAFHD